MLFLQHSMSDLCELALDCIVVLSDFVKQEEFFHQAGRLESSETRISKTKRKKDVEKSTLLPKIMSIHLTWKDLID